MDVLICYFLTTKCYIEERIEPSKTEPHNSNIRKGRGFQMLFNILTLSHVCYIFTRWDCGNNIR